MFNKKQEELMKKDFRNYAHVIWKHLSLPPLTPVQNDICNYIQHGGRRIQVAAFRGVHWVGGLVLNM